MTLNIVKYSGSEGWNKDGGVSNFVITINGIEVDRGNYQNGFANPETFINGYKNSENLVYINNRLIWDGYDGRIAYGTNSIPFIDHDQIIRDAQLKEEAALYEAQRIIIDAQKQALLNEAERVQVLNEIQYANEEIRNQSLENPFEPSKEEDSFIEKYKYYLIGLGIIILFIGLIKVWV